jgi:large subunit ribosomal protein L19
MNLYQVIKQIDQQQLKNDIPTLSFGDKVQVGVFIQEGNKQRIQNYQGTLISQNRAGKNSTITVRRIFQGIGVERVFLFHSPTVKSIKVLQLAKVRRAKLYYLRNLTGKATRLRKRFVKT